jgi:hypothetical protein
MSTTSLLSAKGRFFRFLGSYRSLIATGGSTSKFTVADLADSPENSYAAWQLRVTSGPAKDDLRVLGAGPNTLGELEPKRAFSGTVAAGNTAELWGNSIHGGSDLTALFNDVLTVARPYVPTELTIVTGQRVYDITAYVKDPDDVRRVFIRNIDSAALEPYNDVPLSHFRAFVFFNASTGVREVKLDIGMSLTLSAATTGLWFRGYKTLTAFTTDASTVESDYADWLAWEAVLRHAVDMQTQGQTDNARWQRLSIRAAGMVQAARAQFMPYVPLFQRSFEASA